MFRWATRSGRNPEIVTRAKDATFYAPFHWKTRRRIFTCSLSDFFITEADRWREPITQIMRGTPRHTYLILTKEIERAVELKWQCPPNAMLGISAENQYWLDKRMPFLLKVQAPRYFVSAEPLLGQLDFSRWITSLSWVIVGGESGGPKHRSLVRFHKHLRPQWCPTHQALQWLRSIRDQCQQLGVFFFFKQFGGPRPDSGGAILDGREWKEIP